MSRIRELETLVAIADTGAFTRAGKRLGMSPPAVTRIVAALEDRLGAQMFHRTTRRVRLTDAGARLVESSRRLLTELESAEREAVGITATPHGHLTITGSVTFGRDILTQLVADFLNGQPKIAVSLVLVDRVVNLIEEGIDVGIRLGELPD